MAATMIPATATHAVPIPSRTDNDGGAKTDDWFHSTFITEVTLDDSVMTTPDDFDPFHIGDASTHNQLRISPPVNTTNNVRGNNFNKIVGNTDAATNNTTSNNDNLKSTELGKILPNDDTNGDNQSDLSETGSKSTPSKIFPPHMLVKLKVHEEVSSVAPLSSDEGVSEVFVEGTIMAQVVSSDACKNVPFVLSSTSLGQDMIDFIPNEDYTKTYLTKGTDSNRGNKVAVVRIPKEVVAFVNIGKYHATETVKHMPLLVEQKVVRSKNKIQVAVQVRSKLSNPDDLYDFTIAISIPGRINGNSVTIVSGEGEWDRMKRCVTWELDRLTTGQSFMVSAKCTLDESADDNPAKANDNAGLKFPVMLRCRSRDQICSTQFQAVEASGHPASVSSSVVDKTFRIVHRLK